MMQTIREMDFKNKRVFIRVDFNVPLKAVGAGSKSSRTATRIEGALRDHSPCNRSGREVHSRFPSGPARGKRVKKYSLEPVGQKLSELLQKDVILTEDCIGDGPRGFRSRMRPGEVMLLENLRFQAGEEENSTEFANKLARALRCLRQRCFRDH